MIRLTISRRLALLFTAGFLLSGALVQGIVFWRLDDRLRPPSGERDRAERLADLDLPPIATERSPDEVILPDGRTLGDVLVQAQDRFRTDTLTELAIWSTIALLLTAVLAAGLGWWLARRALQPMARITATTQRITATSLDTRLDWDGPDDEVADLARTVDDMLGRIEDGVAAQQQFAAMASHELTTPLAAIELEADLATRDPSSVTVEELAERTGAAAARANRLVAKLLDLARSRSGAHTWEPVELWRVADDALGRRLPSADDRRITVDFAPGSGRVVGDRALLDSLADNLIENAIRHNVDGGTVSIAIEPAGDDVASRIRLVVANSGPPITAEQLGRITRPFRRGVDNPERLGHGLGLTIVRTIADRHGGTVALDPLDTGGLRVVVDLPAAPDPIA